MGIRLVTHTRLSVLALVYVPLMPHASEHGDFELLARLDHPHIMRYFDRWHTQADGWVVSDWYDGGDLFEYVRRHHHVVPHTNGLSRYHAPPVTTVLRLVKQILHALNYLHTEIHYCHRDLKLEYDDPQAGIGLHCVCARACGVRVCVCACVCVCVSS